MEDLDTNLYEAIKTLKAENKWKKMVNGKRELVESAKLARRDGPSIGSIERP